MNYTLNIKDGQLSGWQDVRSVVRGFQVRESQFFYTFGFGHGFVSIDCGDGVYRFSTADWGTMENCRNAADKFTSGDWDNYVSVWDSRLDSINCDFYYVRPNNEEALIA